MANKIQFTTNYRDISTDRGFQYEFICDHCGTGHRNRFQEWAVGNVSGVVEAASSLFGGIFNQASDITERVRSAGWQKAHDEAFEKASQEMMPDFAQCPRCNKWVCRERCWNEKKGLCKGCAPDLGVEMSAAQASKSVEEVWAHAAMAEEDKKLGTEVWREGIKASCPKCEKPLANNAKFCPNCGANLKADPTCSKCNAKLLPGAKFCGECGNQTA